jgi:hypothetical protein
MSLLYRFPIVHPAKCFTQGCDNPQDGNGTVIFCRRCHEEIAALEAQDRRERARPIVDEIEREVALRLRKRARQDRKRQVWEWLICALFLAVMVACVLGFDLRQSNGEHPYDVPTEPGELR